MGYIDDSYLQGGTFSDCNTNVAATTKLFTDLGFILNHEKSVFEPKQVITFLGFVLNSVTLTVPLTPEKATKLVTKRVLFRDTEQTNPYGRTTKASLS